MFSALPRERQLHLSGIVRGYVPTDVDATSRDTLERMGVSVDALVMPPAGLRETSFSPNAVAALAVVASALGMSTVSDVNRVVVNHAQSMSKKKRTCARTDIRYAVAALVRHTSSDSSRHREHKRLAEEFHLPAVACTLNNPGDVTPWHALDPSILRREWKKVDAHIARQSAKRRAARHAGNPPKRART